MSDKFLSLTGLTYLWSKIKSLIASDSEYGMIKTNPSESVTLNANGQLDVGGRLGQMNGTTGVYSPKTINPTMVADGSFLLTEASGVYLDSKSLAVSTGSNITCRSASAGATEYRVQNTYVNRLSCSPLLISGGIVTLSETDAKAGNYATVTSVQINGSAYVPDSSANSSAQANDIVIKTNKSVNPNSATTSIRIYPAEKSFSNLFVGQAVGGNGGASVIVGQKVASASGNACALIGADMYNGGNGNAVFGRQHISRKNRWFMAGTGHDNTSGASECGAVVGQWSQISSDTAFAVGGGSSHTARKNLFEVKTNGDVYVNGTKLNVP